mmetsp:Transcript_4544/g.10174  ORF Transcript_4544/g.10174 Transcript_4544/m.10174 type:complete len:197 (-) Transcript_4544:48-638(-)
MYVCLSIMWYAFLLACGSSTDNLAVGASLGISNRPLNASVNAIISLMNASGAFVSAAGGYLLGEVAPALAALFAGIIFAYLAVDEITSWQKGHEESTLTMGKSASIRDALRIAVPMTLNNLAGGVAGGAAGVDPQTAGTLALLASYCMMKFGHAIGGYLMPSMGRCIDTRIISGAIFASLSVAQFAQLIDFEFSIV